MKNISKLLLACLLTIGSARATLLTFDDLTFPSTGGAPVPNGYAGLNKGLNWVNMYYLNSGFNSLSPSGYDNAAVSRPNVAFMGDDRIDHPVVVSGPAFKFNSAWLTAAWNDGLNIRIRAFSGGLAG